MLASCHLCMPESTAMVLTVPSPSVPVLLGVQIVLGPPASGGGEHSVTGLLSSLGHSHASGSAQDSSWNQTPPGTVAGAQWEKEAGLPKHLHLCHYWQMPSEGLGTQCRGRSVCQPPTKPLCTCTRGPPRWLALQDVQCSDS